MLISTGQHGLFPSSTMTSRRTPTRSSFARNNNNDNGLFLSPSNTSQSQSQSQSEYHSQTLRVPLLDSPLPSPGLPSPSINSPPPRRRHGAKNSHKRRCSHSHAHAVSCSCGWSRYRWMRRLGRLLLWLAGVAVIAWFARSFLVRTHRSPPPLDFMSPDGESYAIVGSDSLPDSPGPVVVTDRRGRSRWTVSIPVDAPFPLSPTDYTRLCTESTDLARHLEEQATPKQHAGVHAYDYRDPNYMDVHDAQRHGLLPEQPSSSSSYENDNSNVVGGETYAPPHSGADLPLCDKSLTFVLQSHDAGLGVTLLALWTAYGLAQRENRAFFVDDTRWAYGAYTSYFRPPPMPACRPPPVAQRVPCPHQASHLLVSVATTSWTFGHAFHDHFEDAHKMRVERQRPIFELARAGYEALFRLTGDDERYLQARIRSLLGRSGGEGGQKGTNNDDDADGGTVVGIHVRHGDRHPFEFQYHSSYIPLDTYVQAAEDILGHSSSSSSSSPQSDTNSRILLASDDPDVYTATEAAELIKAQRFISLASKGAVDDTAAAAAAPPSANNNANSGWEGGFFAPLFWSLGAPEKESRHHHGGNAGGPLPSQHPPRDPNNPEQKQQNQKKTNKEDSDSHNSNLNPNPDSNPNPKQIRDLEDEEFRFSPPPAALQLRSLVGRAYLLDLAVLGSASDAIVCGVSSASCRVLGVMMGWDAVLASERDERGSGGGGLGGKGGGRKAVWRNVDGSWGWKGIIW